MSVILTWAGILLILALLGVYAYYFGEFGKYRTQERKRFVNEAKDFVENALRDRESISEYDWFWLVEKLGETKPELASFLHYEFKWICTFDVPAAPHPWSYGYGTEWLTPHQYLARRAPRYVNAESLAGYLRFVNG